LSPKPAKYRGNANIWANQQAIEYLVAVTGKTNYPGFCQATLETSTADATKA
jgi:hypothetical protein